MQPVDGAGAVLADEGGLCRQLLLLPVVEEGTAVAGRGRHPLHRHRSAGVPCHNRAALDLAPCAVEVGVPEVAEVRSHGVAAVVLHGEVVLPWAPHPGVGREGVP